MDISGILTEIAAARPKVAGMRYEKEGNQRFRDVLTICRNGRALFERYCYGEAAGLVCVLAGAVDAQSGEICWAPEGRANEAALAEAPRVLTGVEDGKLRFDGGRFLWAPAGTVRAERRAGLSRPAVLFGK